MLQTNVYRLHEATCTSRSLTKGYGDKLNYSSVRYNSAVQIQNLMKEKGLQNKVL